jgi:hypothetical protein
VTISRTTSMTKYEYTEAIGCSLGPFWYCPPMHYPLKGMSAFCTATSRGCSGHPLRHRRRSHTSCPLPWCRPSSGPFPGVDRVPLRAIARYYFVWYLLPPCSPPRLRLLQVSFRLFVFLSRPICEPAPPASSAHTDLARDPLRLLVLDSGECISGCVFDRILIRCRPDKPTRVLAPCRRDASCTYPPPHTTTGVLPFSLVSTRDDSRLFRYSNRPPLPLIPTTRPATFITATPAGQADDSVPTPERPITSRVVPA